MLACSMTGSLNIQTQANFLISESESCAGCQCTVSAEIYADEKKLILVACNPPFLMGVLNSFEGAHEPRSLKNLNCSVRIQQLPPGPGCIHKKSEVLSWLGMLFICA